MKRLEAIIAAAIITGVVALCMLLIGVNALLNPNSVPVSDSPVTTALNSTSTTVDPAQVTQLQSLVTQYQSREKQYQTQLDQANTQLQQYQQVLIELQNAGVIQITSDGQILLRRGRGGDD
jgi:predicted Rossmann fold nucleotide-binding protein DprA/Smf involved in DNA uptake